MSVRPAAASPLASENAPRTFANMLLASSMRARGQLVPPDLQISSGAPRQQAPLPGTVPNRFPGFSASDFVPSLFDEAPEPEVATARPRSEPTLQALRMQANLLRKDLEDVVAGINVHLAAGRHLRSWPILPGEIFNGPSGNFLMATCNVFQASPCNTMLLPTLPAGVEFFKLPRHPLFVSSNVIRTASTRVNALRTRFALQEKSQTRSERQTTDHRDAMVKALHADVQSMITEIAVSTFGQAAWDTHACLFNEELTRKSPDGSAA